MSRDFNFCIPNNTYFLCQFSPKGLAAFQKCVKTSSSAGELGSREHVHPTLCIHSVWLSNLSGVAFEVNENFAIDLSWNEINGNKPLGKYAQAH